MVKNLPAIQETQVQSLGWKDPLEKGMATHSSILAWRIQWTKSLVGYSPWNHKESDTTEQITLSLFFHVYRAYSLNNRVYFMHLYFLVLLASKASLGY